MHARQSFPLIIIKLFILTRSWQSFTRSNKDTLPVSSSDPRDEEHVGVCEESCILWRRASFRFWFIIDNYFANKCTNSLCSGLYVLWCFNVSTHTECQQLSVTKFKIYLSRVIFRKFFLFQIGQYDKTQLQLGSCGDWLFLQFFIFLPQQQQLAIKMWKYTTNLMEGNALL